MKVIEMNGYEFRIKSIRNNKEIVKVEVYRIWGKEKEEAETGYMSIEDAKKAFGYNYEEDDPFYNKIPDIGYINMIALDKVKNE